MRQTIVISVALVWPLSVSAQDAHEPDSNARDARDAQDAGTTEAAQERAAMHIELATAHFEGGRYDRALLELQTVRELTGRSDILYNMARCYEAMGRTPPAVSHYRRFLGAGVGSVELNDDAARRLEALTGQANGEAEPTEDGPGTGTLLGLTIGGVGLLTGAVFGILTLVEDASLSEGCGATHSCGGEDLADIRVFRAVADLAFTLAVIGGGAGLIALFLFMREGADEDTDEPNAFVAPWIVPGEGGGATAEIRF